MRQRSQPFALWLSLVDPHPPLAIHEPYDSMYDPRRRAAAGARADLRHEF